MRLGQPWAGLTFGSIAGDLKEAVPVHACVAWASPPIRDSSLVPATNPDDPWQSGSTLTHMLRLLRGTTEPAGVPPTLENQVGFKEGQGCRGDTKTTKNALEGSWWPSPGARPLRQPVAVMRARFFDPVPIYWGPVASWRPLWMSSHSETVVDGETRDQILGPGQPLTTDHSLCAHHHAFTRWQIQVVPFWTVRTDLGGVVLNEASQTERDEHHMTPLTHGTDTHRNEQTRKRTLTGMENKPVVARGGSGGRWWSGTAAVGDGDDGVPTSSSGRSHHGDGQQSAENTVTLW